MRVKKAVARLELLLEKLKGLDQKGYVRFHDGNKYAHIFEDIAGLASGTYEHKGVTYPMYTIMTESEE